MTRQQALEEILRKHGLLRSQAFLGGGHACSLSDCRHCAAGRAIPDLLAWASPQVTRGQLFEVVDTGIKGALLRYGGQNLGGDNVVAHVLTDKLLALLAPQEPQWCEHLQYERADSRWVFSSAGEKWLVKERWQVCPLCATPRPQG